MFWGRGLELLLDEKKFSYENQSNIGPARIGLKRFVEVSSQVSPASTFNDTAIDIKMFVNGMGIGNKHTLVAAQEFVDGSGIMFGRIAKQHVSFRGNDNQK
jgi:hypothetical protein